MDSRQKPHVIRLRGPWQVKGAARVKLPTTWSEALGGARQGVLSRAFHCPTNLTDGDTVLLRVESPQQVEQIVVNGSEVAHGDNLRPLLAESNRLTIELSCSDADATLLSAHLEITS